MTDHNGPVRTTVDGRTLVITLDRPKANAIDVATSRARPTLVAATVSRVAPSHCPIRSKPRPSSPSRLATGTRQPEKTSSHWW